VAGSLSVQDNILLPNATRYWHKRSLACATVASVIDGLDVRPKDPHRLVRELSGGNQQRVIIGKWLMCEPKVLILDDPTVGVDPGARERIFEAIRRRLDAGLSVILFSSEPQQLVEHCSRVLVVADGCVARELTGRDLSYRDVSRFAVA
jgi:ABC-type sugar transport system ATPase subunit